MSKTQIPTGGITADAIDGTLIADDAINSEHYTDGSIDTAFIADSQVTAAKTSGVGITLSQQWRVTTSFSFSTEQDISSNWEKSDSTGYSSIGSDLTESSGIFTFPSTGFYLIVATFNFRRATGERAIGGNIKVTTNNSSYSIVSSAETNNSDIV